MTVHNSAWRRQMCRSFYSCLTSVVWRRKCIAQEEHFNTAGTWAQPCYPQISSSQTPVASFSPPIIIPRGPCLQLKSWAFCFVVRKKLFCSVLVSTQDESGRVWSCAIVSGLLYCNTQIFSGAEVRDPHPSFPCRCTGECWVAQSVCSQIVEVSCGRSIPF